MKTGSYLNILFLHCTFSSYHFYKKFHRSLEFKFSALSANLKQFSNFISTNDHATITGL